MSVRSLLLCVVAACAFALPLTGSASGDLDAQLRQADAVRSSDPAAFAALLKRANAERAGATQAQIEHLDYLNAYALAYSGQYDRAIVAARKLFDRSNDPAVKLRAGSLMVNTYALSRQFAEGLRQLERNLPLLDRVDDRDLRQHAIGVAAVLYNDIGQYRLALQSTDGILAEGGTARTVCFANQFRLEALYSLKAMPADDASVENAIAQCESQKEGISANFMRAFLARKWAAQGQRGKAIAYLQEHLPDAEATQYPRLIGEINSLLAEFLLAEGDSAAAEHHAEAAIAQGPNMKYSLPLAAAYRVMYEVADGRHDLESALEMYRKYADTQKAYLNEVKARELAYQLVRQESRQKTQQIDLLNQKNKVLELQQRVDQQKARFSRLLIVLLLLLVGSIGYWAYKIKRVQLSLRRMAQTDALTGICNRHYFSQQAEQVLRDGARAGEDVALIMFDLDHFKSINDRFGHDTGDWVLKRVAEACRTFCRRIDILGRLGGEEFAILLTGCDLRGATRVAEDCRVRLATLDSQPSGHKFVNTASFGVTASSLSTYDLAKLLAHADQMLYRAKREGRNRVCSYDGQLQQWPQVLPAAADAAPPPTRADDMPATQAPKI